MPLSSLKSTESRICVRVVIDVASKYASVYMNPNRINMSFLNSMGIPNGGFFTFENISENSETKIVQKK